MKIIQADTKQSQGHVIVLTPKEGALLIAHLAAQLANTNLPNQQIGACYSTTSDDYIRYHFMVVDEKTEQALEERLSQ